MQCRYTNESTREDRKIKHMQIREEDTKIGSGAAIRKQDDKHRTLIEKEDNDKLIMYDEVGSWRYAETVSDEKIKGEDEDKKTRRADNPKKGKPQSEEKEDNVTITMVTRRTERGEKDVKKGTKINPKSLDNYEVHEETEYKNQTMLNSMWMVDEKEEGRIEARVLTKRNQEDIETEPDLLTAAKNSIRYVLTYTGPNSVKTETATYVDRKEHIKPIKETKDGENMEKEVKLLPESSKSPKDQQSKHSGQQITPIM